MLPKRAAIQHYWPASSSAHIAGRRCRPFCINVLPFSLHGFPAPFRRRFPALPCGVIAVYPMQTVFRFSRCGAGSGNKKSPHNNLNLTIPSGMALVRVCYAAPNHENPNLFSIGEGLGFFVFFGNENNGSSLTAVCPKPYQKKDRITKVTTVRVP